MAAHALSGSPLRASRVNLREQVAASLRASLVAGDFRPGVTYSAPALAAEFGVSPTPVREAMLELIKEGMMLAAPNKGFRVVETSHRDMDDMTELRRLVEVPTVGHIATIATDEQVDHLRKIAARVAKAAAEGHVVAFIEADRQFHRDLLIISGNARIVELVDQLRTKTRLWSLAAGGDLEQSSEDHFDLVEALAAHDRRGAERIMAAHLKYVRGIWADNN